MYKSFKFETLVMSARSLKPQIHIKDEADFVFGFVFGEIEDQFIFFSSIWKTFRTDEEYDKFVSITHALPRIREAILAAG